MSITKWSIWIFK